MKKPSRLDYAYAVGRVRARERYLLQRAVFREAADAADFTAALKLVYEAGDYKETLIKVRNSQELDSFLAGEEENLRVLISELLLDREIFDAFLLDDNPVRAMVVLGENGNHFVRDYLRHRIDLGNLKTYCRAKYLEYPPEVFQRKLLKGGFLEENEFLENYDLTFAEMAEKLRPSPYQGLCERATDLLEERETFIGLERMLEDFLMRYLRRAKNYAFGPEPVFAYGLAKRKELSLLRLLGSGKMNDLPSILLKDRMSETYV